MPRRILAAFAAVGAASAVAVSTAGASTSQPLGVLGAASHSPQATYEGYYDGHKDAYLITDVSSKSQASALHINYSSELQDVKGAPLQYFILGRAAPGQISVFGSEPGESNYNPLWQEVFVTWKPGVTPVLLHQDDQIDMLAKEGKLTMKVSHIVINAPITKVGKGG
jgi:hypothetical protein